MSARLRDRVRGLDGKPYGAYKNTLGRWGFEDFELSIDHVQGDPFAAPSRVSVRIAPPDLGPMVSLLGEPARATGVADALIRRFARIAKASSAKTGSGKSGMIAIDEPGAQVLVRSALQVDEEGLEARFFVGLPAAGRRILGRAAAALLTETLPDIVRRALLTPESGLSGLRRAAEVNEDAEALRAQLVPNRHVAFVADGSVLPRLSGASSEPMGKGAIPFRSPESMATQYHTPNGGTVRGMGVPEGMTLIVGGGFHGKSTLLRALELGVWNHRPGDGRERVVTRRNGVKVRAEDGRAAHSVDVSAYIGALPSGASTERFSTANASGSTSQAVNVAEALEMGASVLLIDEDTAATNFMSRDRIMAQLVASACEPIRPFSRVAPGLVSSGATSLVMAMGATSAFLPHADRVIHMNEYKAMDVTNRARGLSETAREREESVNASAPAFRARRLRPHTIPGMGDRGFRFRTHGRQGFQLGEAEVDLRLWEQLVSTSQLRAMAATIGEIVREAPREGAVDLAELCHRWEARMSKLGWDSREGKPAVDHAEFRAVDLAAALNRIREAQFLVRD